MNSLPARDVPALPSPSAVACGLLAQRTAHLVGPLVEMQSGLARCLLFRASAPEGCVLRPASRINRGAHSVCRLGPRELVSHHRGFAQLASARRHRLQITRAPAGRSVTLAFSASFVSAHLFFLPPPHLAHPRLNLRASTHASLFLLPPPPPRPPLPPFCSAPFPTLFVGRHRSRASPPLSAVSASSSWFASFTPRESPSAQGCVPSPYLNARVSQQARVTTRVATGSIPIGGLIVDKPRAPPRAARLPARTFRHHFGRALLEGVSCLLRRPRWR